MYSIKRLLPHVLIIIGFVVISLAYFSPVLQGKAIFQSDIMHYIGMAKQQNEFRKNTGTETYWTNSAFGGMPTYQLGAKYPHNYIKKLDSILRFLPRPADYLFLYMIGIYILLLVLKLDYKLAGLGALAFGFSTYLIIILGVGHNAKAHAIAYMPLVLSGILLAFQKRYVAGFLLTAVAMALEICANHFQMSYYLFLLVVVLGIVYFIDALKRQQLPHFFKAVGILIIAVILSVGLNATNVLATQEYVKSSTRGQSELTINPDGSPKDMTTGLDKDYITEYSYGFLESFNLFIPRLMGGGAREDVGTDSAMYKFYTNIGATPVEAARQVENTPTYWGDQPIVEAPAYVGAVVLFLFVLALFLVKGRLKWWLVTGTIVSLLLSYGKNLGFITDFFIDFVPFYSKFRAVSSIQVILELCIPVLAMVGLARLLGNKLTLEDKMKALMYATSITAGLALLFLLFKSTFFDFVGANDGYYRQAYGTYGQSFVEALRQDRERFFTQDTIRTLIFVLLSAALVWSYLKNKLNSNKIIIGLALLIVFDLVGVDRRYVNNDNFVPASQVNTPFHPNAADKAIMKDKGHFRVFDVMGSPARASYFHNSLTGYHAAKLGRYNELFNFHIQKNNIEVLNMLNTKYIIAEDEQQQPKAYTRFTEPNGNAWFVSDLERVADANTEIRLLDSINTKQKAITTMDMASRRFELDSTARIDLEVVQPNYLKYQTHNSNDGFMVCSEIYYMPGWQAYIDGKPVDHIRVNYVLRGLLVPKGTHSVEFRFDPQVIHRGSSIALTSSIVLGVLLLGGFFYERKSKGGIKEK